MTPSVQPQPLIVVPDVPRASAWYERVLGAVRDHGGEEYQRLLVDGTLVLQLHDMKVDHHHGPLADPTQPLGNGTLLWFAVDEFDQAVGRIRALGAELVRDVHVNPNALQREIWARDPNGYLVVLAEARPADA